MNNSIIDYNNSHLVRPLYISITIFLIVSFGVVIYGPIYVVPLFAFSIFIINIFLSFEKKGSYILAFMLLIAIYLLMITSNNNNGMNTDYFAYHSLYNHFLNGGKISNITGYSTDYGYMLLMLAISKIGISYNLFLTLIVTTSIILMSLTLSKITENFNLVLVLYALSPLIYDVYQTRYLLSYSLIIFGLRYILFKDRENLVKYGLIVGIATFFHETAIFFFLYLLLKMKVKSILQLGVLISGLITIISFTTNMSIINLISPFFPGSRFEQYSSSSLGYELNPVIQFMIIFISLMFTYVVKYIKLNEPSFTNRRILWLNYLNFFVFPFLLISLDFERFLRPVMLVNFALIAEKNGYFSPIKRFITLTSLIIVLFVWFFSRAQLIINVLQNNFIYELFFVN